MCWNWGQLSASKWARVATTFERGACFASCFGKGGEWWEVAGMALVVLPSASGQLRAVGSEVLRALLSTRQRLWATWYRPVNVYSVLASCKCWNCSPLFKVEKTSHGRMCLLFGEGVL